MHESEGWRPAPPRRGGAGARGLLQLPRGRRRPLPQAPTAPPAAHSHRRPRTPRRAPTAPPGVHSHCTTTYLRERTTFCASCVQRLLLCFARTAACTPAGAVTRREGPATVDTPAAKSRPRLTRQPRRAACREEQLERDRPRRAGRCLDASQLSSRRAGDRGRAKAQFSVASRVFSAASPPSFHGRPQAWRPGSRRRSGLVEAP